MRAEKAGDKVHAKAMPARAVENRKKLSSFGKPGLSRHCSYESQFFSLDFLTIPPFNNLTLNSSQVPYCCFDRYIQTHTQTFREAFVTSHNKSIPASAISIWIYSTRCLFPTHILQHVLEKAVISFPLRRILSHISLFSFFIQPTFLDT